MTDSRNLNEVTDDKKPTPRPINEIVDEKTKDRKSTLNEDDYADADHE